MPKRGSAYPFLKTVLQAPGAFYLCLETNGSYEMSFEIRQGESLREGRALCREKNITMPCRKRSVLQHIT